MGLPFLLSLIKPRHNIIIITIYTEHRVNMAFYNPGELEQSILITTVSASGKEATVMMIT